MTRRPTRGTEERFTIRTLVNTRGLSLALALFSGTTVGAEDVTAIYRGEEVAADKWPTVQRVLRERMTKD